VILPNAYFQALIKKPLEKINQEVSVMLKNNSLPALGTNELADIHALFFFLFMHILYRLYHGSKA